MSSCRLTLTTLILVSLGLLGSNGCGGGDCNEITGSAEKSYDLAFDRVEIRRQEKRDGTLDAMTVEYLRGGVSEQQIPVKVIAKAPVEPDVDRDISGDGGGITRAMNDHSVFQDLKAGTFRTDKTGVGDDTDGKFFVTFDNGRTLNGTFCGTIKLLKL